MASVDEGSRPSSSRANGDGQVALRREPPYWHVYRTFAKERWLGRKLVEVMTTDFRDRSAEYYQWAIHKGHCNINGEKKDHDYIIKMGDQLQNKVHRHEPAVTAEPIRVIYRDDKEGRLVIVKPGSIPVHAAGRYNKLTLQELIKRDLNISKVYTSNRLDRLTSGIMVCSTKKQTAHALSEAFALGKVRKAYVCRVKGEFPEEEVLCKEPLLQCDRQTGISVIHPIGKESETIFNRMSYDSETNTSAVYCRPITGRTHQIRAHLQYLGYPIPNDPIYCHRIWQQYPPQIFKNLPLKLDRWKVEPECSMNVYGSPEIDEVANGLKMDRDEKENWNRWKDETMFKSMLKQEGFQWRAVAGPNGESPAVQRLRAKPLEDSAEIPSEKDYCEECKIPLAPDPEEEGDLYIYLHAIKYETEDWSYEDDLPWWAHSDWTTRERTYSSEAAVVEDVKQYVKSPELTKQTKANGSAMVNGKQELGPAGRDKTLPKIAMDLPDVVPILHVEEDRQKMDVPGETCNVAVMFEVFGGMEDFAAIDILQKIRAVLPNETIDSPQARLHTSHIIIHPGLQAKAAMQLFLAGQLNSVKNAYLKIWDENIPTEMLVALERERMEAIMAKASLNQSKRARKRAKKAGEVVELPSEKDLAAMERTEAEERLLELLRAAWDQSKQIRESALVEWRKFKECHREPSIEDKLHYRGTVDRTGFSFPTLNTTTFERIVGTMTWHWLNGGEGEGPWGVDLMKPDLDLVVKMLPGWSEGQDANPYWRSKNVNFPGSFYFMIRIPARDEILHRPKIPAHLVEGGTSLLRFRSYTLATALPVMQAAQHSNQSTPLAIWEPCVGTGSIAIELDATLSKRRCNYQIFGSDLFSEEIEKAKEVCRLCKTSNRVTLANVDGTDLAACIAFLGGQEVVDGIVTDLPWGRRVLNHMTIAVLYPALLKVWIQVLKPGGTVAVMTAEQRTFLRSIKAHEGDMRRRDTGWFLAVEKVQTSGISGVPDNDILKGEEREAKMRTVECGYDVSVIFLRKRSLID